MQAFLLVFLLSVVTFSISVNSPIDSIELKYSNSSDNLQIGGGIEEKKILDIKEEMGFLLPAFYFKIVPATFPNGFYKIRNQSFRALLEELSYYGYDGDLFLAYFTELEKSYYKDGFWNDLATNEALIEFNFLGAIDQHPAFWTRIGGENSKALQIYSLLEKAQKAGQSKKRFLPKFLFFKSNQYHQWLLGGSHTNGVIKGDFGRSVVNDKPVVNRIKKALPWTFVLSLITIILSLVSSIIVGLLLGYFNNLWWSKGINSFLFLIYTMPSFWVATLLMVFFSNPDFFNWFPAGGVKSVSSSAQIGFWAGFFQSFEYVVLPVIAMSYGTIAMLTRYVQSSSIESLRSIYIFSARTRGLTEKRVVLKHVLPNVLLPLVTIIGAALPGLFSGAIVIETIFSIPGMGLELFKATLNNDVNLVVGILTISGLLTVVGYLISDALYSIVDPRIKLEEL